jgi:hypothetical protein
VIKKTDITKINIIDFLLLTNEFIAITKENIRK